MRNLLLCLLLLVLPMSVIEVYEAVDGKLAGRVTQILQSTRGPDPLCEKCRGERRNQPIEGMVILWGMQRSGDEWKGGQILDPASGKVYSATLRPLAGGKQLQVRGFMGFSLLGRT